MDERLEGQPLAPRDLFQDYDIVFLVRDLEHFVTGHSYAQRFGKPLMVQMPETMRDPMGDGRFTYLTLYEDGNRVDLQLFPVERWREFLGSDSETIALLDKDGILPEFPPASDRSYHIVPPTENSYRSCCNNFWWCLQNVAKGIWREEIPYAKETLERYVREELNDMVCWYIGTQRGFALSCGKMGKYFKRCLEPAYYHWYTLTYADAQPEHLWDSLFAMCGLFRQLARQVGEAFGYVYCEEDDRRMTEYLRCVRRLPPDAKEFSDFHPGDSGGMPK